MIRLVVGLGNPGLAHAANRHNVGFMVLDRLGARLVAGDTGRCGRIRVGERDVVLLEPMTYMNRSGISVAAAMQAFDVPIEDVLVVHDDLDLPFGRLKLKRGGGAGGHNGLRSIIEEAGGPEFARLRVGIGRPENPEVSVRDHVLGDFSQSEGVELERVLHDATRALRAVLEDGLTAAMNTVNARRRHEGPDKPEPTAPRSGLEPGPEDREEP